MGGGTFSPFRLGLETHVLLIKIVIIMDIEARVKAIIIEKLNVEESAVVPTASFTNDLGADSLDTVELIMDLEKEFGVTIPDEDAEKITTVGQAVEYLKQHQE